MRSIDMMAPKGRCPCTKIYRSIRISTAKPKSSRLSSECPKIMEPKIQNHLSSIEITNELVEITIEKWTRIILISDFKQLDTKFWIQMPLIWKTIKCRILSPNRLNYYLLKFNSNPSRGTKIENLPMFADHLQVE